MVITNLLMITQLYQSSALSGFHMLIIDVEQCVDSIGGWMTGNRQMITQLLWGEGWLGE